MNLQTLSNELKKQANGVLEEYLRNVEAYCKWIKVELPNGDKTEPDDSFMQLIEVNVGIDACARKTFREIISIEAGTAKRRGRKFTLWSNNQLCAGILKYVTGELVAQTQPYETKATIRGMEIVVTEERCVFVGGLSADPVDTLRDALEEINRLSNNVMINESPLEMRGGDNR